MNKGMHSEGAFEIQEANQEIVFQSRRHVRIYFVCQVEN